MGAGWIMRLMLAAVMVPMLALGSVAQDTTTSPIPGLDRRAFGEEIRRYILENPEVVIEAIDIWERQRKVREAAEELKLVDNNLEALTNDGFSFVAGNPEGSITMVEFLDYRCGYCKRAHADVKTLLRSDGDIKLIIKEFPILGPESTQASKAALALLRQEDGKYYGDFSDKLMTFGGPITDAVIDRMAERAGANVAQMREDMKLAVIDEQIRANYTLAQALRISGTPTFIFGTKIIRGFIPLDEMVKVVELARNAQN